MENGIIERWKDIEGYEGYYQVSNLGNVKSISRQVYHPITNIQLINERILKPDLRRGYKYVSVSKNGIKKGFLVHRLVGFHFLNSIEGKNEINHKNGIKTDNRVENLEWVNSSENQKHAVKIGLQFSGSKHTNSKLNDDQIIEIRDSIKSYSFLALEYNVSKSTISNIKTFKTYK